MAYPNRRELEMIVFLICSQGKVFGKEQLKLGDAGGMVQLYGRRV